MATTQTDEWRAWREQVARAAHERALTLLREWLPDGKQEGREYRCGSLNGDKGRSLTVWLDKGNWKDFGSDAKGGNLVALYAQLQNVDYRTANEDLAQKFGIPKPEYRRAQRWKPIIPVPDFAPLTDEGAPALEFALPGDPVGWWWYYDADGRPLYCRVRLETSVGKQFRPLTFCRNVETGQVGWQMLDHVSPRPIYGLELLAALPEAPVLFVEGEKTADAARALFPDWVCITAGSSSINGKSTDWSPLLTRTTRIVIWPDNDKSGLHMAAALGLFLQGKAEIVQPDQSWKEGWDLADALTEAWTTTRAQEYLESHVIATAPSARSRIECEISGSDLEVRSRAVFTAISDVHKQEGPGLFRSVGELTVIQNHVALPADLSRLRQWLTMRIAFQGRDHDGNLRATMPPDKLLENIAVYYPSPLPKLTRVVRRPVFTAEGKLIVEPGYNEQSGLLYLPPPELAGLTPTTDVAGARGLIEDLLCDFNFVAPADRAHFYAFLLQPAFRELIDGPTPVYRFEAPKPGTGKGLLFEVGALILGGWTFTTPCETEEEWGKSLLTHLRASPEILLFDNCDNLRSYNLAAALTAWPTWTARLLGQSTSITVPVRTLWAATINNPQMSAEMLRRTVRIAIHAGDGVENPHLRVGFRHDPIIDYVKELLYPLSQAVVTLAAVAKERMAPFTARRLGSFEHWARVMGGALGALGIEHFLERDSQDLAEDRTEFAWREFVTAWCAQFADQWVRCKDLLDTAQHTDLDLGSGKDLSQQQRLGRLLMRRRNTVIEGRQLQAAPGQDKALRYRLVKQDEKR